MAGCRSSQSHSLVAYSDYSRAHLLYLSFLFRATNATSMVTVEMMLAVRSNASPCACKMLAPRSYFLLCNKQQITDKRLTMYVVYVGVMHVGLLYVLHG